MQLLSYIVFTPITDTLIFQVSEDTYVDLYHRNTNYGTLPELVVDGKGGLKRGFFITPWWNGSFEAFERAAFLKFNVSGLSDIIVEAKVFLYCLNGGIGGGIYALDPLMDDLNWSETQATWNNRPSKHYDGNTFQDFLDTVNAGSWYAFDVTEALFGKRDGAYSFGIVMQQDQYTTWSSKEGSHPPYIMIRVKKSGFEVSGNNYYYSNNNPIENVKLEMTGGLSQILYSDGNGAYCFSGLYTGEEYTIVASKTADTDIGPYDITTYDAALTAQAAVGVRELTDNQKIAADVSLDGQIYTYDAALIAQYSVGLPKLPVSHVGEWFFIPENRIYSDVNSNYTNQDFIGIILGNVHGGWIQPENQPGTGKPLHKYQKLPELNVYPGQQVQIPLEIVGGDNVISLDIDFSYDPDILKFRGVKRTGLDYHAEMYYNAEPGGIRIGIYSIEPLTTEGEMLVLKFDVIGRTEQSSTFSLDRYLVNNDVVWKGKSKIYVSKDGNIPLKYHLSQNYPNPFFVGRSLVAMRSQTTKINYQIPKTTHVCIKIYNCLGQEIRTLIDKAIKAGSHTVYWNGRNTTGKLVSTGIYIYRFETIDHVEMKRLILFR